MAEVLKYLRRSGASFATTVAACVALRPDDVLSHNGLSFYGNFRQTLLPYSLGLGLTALFLLRAGRLLDKEAAWRPVRRWLVAVAWALLGVVLTPSFSTWRVVQLAHIACGAVVFGLQLAVSWRLVRRSAPPGGRWLLRVQVAALGVLLLSFGLVGELSLMLPAQALASAAFGVLLLRAVRRQLTEVDVILTAPVHSIPPGKL